MHKKTLAENLALCDISMTLFYHSIIAIDLLSNKPTAGEYITDYFGLLTINHVVLIMHF